MRFGLETKKGFFHQANIFFDQICLLNEHRFFNLAPFQILMETDQPNVRSEFQLAEDNELRFEVGEEEIIVELVEGTAEVFGTPLSLHKRYNIPPGLFIFMFTS